MKSKYSLKKRIFLKEFKRQLRFGIAAAVGFSIAFAWREPFLKFMNGFIVEYISKTIHYYMSVLSALVITFLGAVILWLSARYIR